MPSSSLPPRYVTVFKDTCTKGLQEQIEAIREFFVRRRLDWGVYESDVRSIRSTPAAARFLVDLATAADMPAFLQERFGH